MALPDQAIVEFTSQDDIHMLAEYFYTVGWDSTADRLLKKNITKVYVPGLLVGILRHLVRIMYTKAHIGAALSPQQSLNLCTVLCNICWPMRVF